LGGFVVAANHGHASIASESRCRWVRVSRSHHVWQRILKRFPSVCSRKLKSGGLLKAHRQRWSLTLLLSSSPSTPNSSRARAAETDGGERVQEALRPKRFAPHVARHARQELLRLPSGHRRGRRRHRRGARPHRRRAHGPSPSAGRPSRRGRARRFPAASSRRKHHRRHCQHAPRRASAEVGGGRQQRQRLKQSPQFHTRVGAPSLLMYEVGTAPRRKLRRRRTRGPRQ